MHLNIKFWHFLLNIIPKLPYKISLGLIISKHKEISCLFLQKLAGLSHLYYLFFIPLENVSKSIAIDLFDGGNSLSIKTSF